ncbi:MAG: CHASE2 domain-containing protein [Chitinophagia bacterium]|nr:CHASE2 domain-containing protein [Chitinophagia bacterium]
MKFKTRLYWLFNSRVFKLLFFYFLVQGLGWLLSLVLSLDIMNVPRLELDAANDLSLNDLHYKINSRTRKYAPGTDIILINSGDLDPIKFRQELADLIKIVSLYDAKVIGIDHTFSKDPQFIGSAALIEELSENKKVVLALNTQGKDHLKIQNATYGTVNLIQEPQTVRKYEGGGQTFAAQIVRKFGVKHELPEDPFLINYVAPEYQNITFDSQAVKELAFSEPRVVPVFNAHEVMTATDASMLKGKIVLIGHFGSTALRDIKNDLEDKFSVPSDVNMIFRSPSMPGALIHANAIDNLLRKEVRFRDISATWWFKFLGLLFIFAYLYFLIFMEAGKVINILVMLGLSLPALYVVLYLMQYNLYIEMGSTLLQLLVFEEMVEIFSPLYNWIQNKLKPAEL